MKNINFEVENLINKVLSEEIQRKANIMLENVENEWMEIVSSDEFDEEWNEDIDEQETEEGNAFGKAVTDAKKSGKKEFKFGGKNYEVTSESKNLRFTEDELISLIEEIILEETTNISKKEPEGFKKTKTALDASKKENEDYINKVTQKMKEYLKDGSKGEFEMNPKIFPKSNGELGEMKKKAYKPSDAVEEYIENFAYAAGLDELVYDEIEPNEEWVKDNIVGSSKTGNGKWANSVETDLGERIYKKSQQKPYSTEKRKGSYKRQSQPIDKAGEHKGKKSIDDMFMKLESKKNNKSSFINEEMTKMKSLISYSRKTQ